jgi:hypothetical protein
MSSVAKSPRVLQTPDALPYPVTAYLHWLCTARGALGQVTAWLSSTPTTVPAAAQLRAQALATLEECRQLLAHPQAPAVVQEYRREQQALARAQDEAQRRRRRQVRP